MPPARNRQQHQAEELPDRNDYFALLFAQVREERVEGPVHGGGPVDPPIPIHAAHALQGAVAP
eukprot:918349-Lingulodinium_polyedra.AAC.1